MSWLLQVIPTRKSTNILITLIDLRLLLFLLYFIIVGSFFAHYFFLEHRQRDHCAGRRAAGGVRCSLPDDRTEVRFEQGLHHIFRPLLFQLLHVQHAANDRRADVMVAVGGHRERLVGHALQRQRHARQKRRNSNSSRSTRVVESRLRQRRRARSDTSAQHTAVSVHGRLRRPAGVFSVARCQTAKKHPRETTSW